MNRRDFLAGSAALTTLGFGQESKSADSNKAQDQYKRIQGNAPVIAMIIYPEFTALDLIGAYQFFWAIMTHRVLLVSKNGGVVRADTGLGVSSEATFKTCPKNIDAIFLPGGTNGTVAAMKDKETIKFIKNAAPNCKLITSVCTGSLILGAAGLLKGKKATTHWLAHETLSDFGAIPVKERVVRDGNIITGAGVSASLDLGMEVVQTLSGEDYAKLCQLFFEYDPKPKFDCGSPDKAPKADVQMCRDMVPQFLADVRSVAKGGAK